MRSAQVVVAVALIASVSHGQSTASGTFSMGGSSAEFALPSERMTEWNLAGVDGGIPTRTTVCDTIDAADFGNGSSEAGGAINTAIAACPVGEVLRLTGSLFLVNDTINLNKGITIRGDGINATELRKTNGAVVDTFTCTESDPIIFIGPARFGSEDNATSVALTSDAAKGATTLSVSSGTGFAAGQLILIDEDHWNNGRSWVEGPNGRDDGGDNSQTDRVSWELWNPSDPNDDPLPSPASEWFARLYRPIAEIHKIASVSGNTITIESPGLHLSMRTAFDAEVTRFTNTAVSGAGVEDLKLRGGCDGNISSNIVQNSWIKNVWLGLWLSHNIDLNRNYKVTVQSSYITEPAWPVPGGGGYSFAIQNGSSSILFENNIVINANKVMVANAAGAGSVIAYNYVDDGRIDGNDDWHEVGLNASHMSTPYMVLFEGNRSWNADQDHTHGNTIYSVFFRNHLTGFRRNYGGSSNQRTAGLNYGAWWQSFVGNVLGLSGQMSGWVYEETTAADWDNKAIWSLGYEATHFEQDGDPQVISTVIRDGNWDYLGNEVNWHNSSPATLPNSLYRTTAPSYFSGYTWPWVDPTGTTKYHCLPAKDRYEDEFGGGGSC